MTNKEYIENRLALLLTDFTNKTGIRVDEVFPYFTGGRYQVKVSFEDIADELTECIILQ